MRIRDIVNEHCRPVDDTNRQIVQFIKACRRTIERDHIFKVANLLRADRRHDILLADRADDVLRR